MASKKRPFPEATKELLAKKPRLVNELLDPKRFLGCLKETTTRNATDSPLLRLPSETRNTIWEYASSGKVELHQHAGRMPSPRKHDALPAFHLPRVCRQIHGETAMLAYSLSIFTFPCYLKCKDCLDKGIFKKWTMQDNRDAITAIEPNAGFIEEYCWLQNLAEFLGCRLYSTGGKLRDTYTSASQSWNM